MSITVVYTVCCNIHSEQMPRVFRRATVVTIRCTFLTFNTTGSCQWKPTKARFV